MQSNPPADDGAPPSGDGTLPADDGAPSASDAPLSHRSPSATAKLMPNFLMQVNILKYRKC